MTEDTGLAYWGLGHILEKLPAAHLPLNAAPLLSEKRILCLHCYAEHSQHMVREAFLLVQLLERAQSVERCSQEEDPDRGLGSHLPHCVRPHGHTTTCFPGNGLPSVCGSQTPQLAAPFLPTAAGGHARGSEETQRRDAQVSPV